MTVFRSGACCRLITVVLCFSACGGSEEEDNAVGTGGSATGGSATGGSSAGATASGGGTGGEITTGGSSGGDCIALTPVQGQVFEGDVFLVTPADVEAAQQYSEITGSLQVHAILEPLDVELPRLRRLGGDLRAESTRLRRFLAPRLEGLDGQLWFYLSRDLVEVDFRNLAEVGANVFIHRNLTLRLLQLDALVSADGIEISGNPELPDCFLDVLGQRFDLLRSTTPECSCTRGCGLIEADCR
jgi:hypothetical protein